MLVVNRFRVPEDKAEAFRVELLAAVAVLAGRIGFVDADAGRNVDDPELWTLVTRWAGVGSYRRALSAYDVKMSAVPLLSRSIDEPSAYEAVSTSSTSATSGEAGTGELNRNVPR